MFVFATFGIAKIDIYGGSSAKLFRWSDMHSKIEFYRHLQNIQLQYYQIYNHDGILKHL